MSTPPNPEAPTVADLLCFDVYATSRAITSFYRPILDRAGLTYPQFLVLTLLWERDSRSMRELVQELGLEYNTLSPLIKRMEAAGLLTRVTHPGDERVVLVQLTPAGRDLHGIGTEMTCELGDALGLDEQDIATLRALLHRAKAGVTRAPDARR